MTDIGYPWWRLKRWWKNRRRRPADTRKQPLPLIDPREYVVSEPQSFDFGNRWGMAWLNPRTGFRHALRTTGRNPLGLRAAVHEHLGLPAPEVVRQGTGERFKVLTPHDWMG